MDLKERVISAARIVCGAGEEEMPVLEALCGASADRRLSRLRSGVAPADCEEALICAAAFTAAADLAAGQGGVTAFSAGALSVKAGTNTGELRRAAERLMEPFVTPGDIFLQGVRT